MMTSGSEAYIRRVKPNEEPTKFSPTTKANIRRAHNASVKTVNVTKTTVGMINNVSCVSGRTQEQDLQSGLARRTAERITGSRRKRVLKGERVRSWMRAFRGIVDHGHASLSAPNHLRVDSNDATSL